MFAAQEAEERRPDGPHPAAAQITRRELLRGAAAAAAAAAIGSVAGPVVPAAARRAPRIAIVGAGIAGLTTALRLSDKGVRATVYEATSHLGGRMRTNDSGYWRGGQMSEWCGELIDSNHQTMRALVKRFDLRLDDVLAAERRRSHDTYFLFGKYYRHRRLVADFAKVHAALKRDVRGAGYPTLYNYSTAAGRKLDRMSVYEWIETRVPGGHTSPFGALLDLAYNTEYAAETTNQSALNLIYLLGFGSSPTNFNMFGESDERFHINGGSEQLPAAIAAKLKERGVPIAEGHRMTAIARRPNGTYRLSFAGGVPDVIADHVVLAMPFAVLRNLDYSRAGFDARKRLAITEMGAGKTAKLVLQFRERVWQQGGAWPGISNGTSYSDTGYQSSWDGSRTQPGKQGQLVVFTGGAVARSFKPARAYGTADTDPLVRTYALRTLNQLNKVYPGIKRQWNGRATLSVPAMDRNIGLSYAFWKPGQSIAFAGYEKVRQGNVHFAGEHTSVSWQGWMEGGAITGIRAANEILADLR